MNDRSHAPNDQPRHLHASNLWKAILGLALCTGSIDLLHIYLSYRLGIEQLDWARTAGVFIVWWLTYTLVLISALFLSRRFPLVPRFPLQRLFLHLAAAAGLAYIHTACNAFLYPPQFQAGDETLHFTLYLARMNFPIDFISYWTIVGVAYAFQFYSSVQERKVAEAELRAKTEQLQASLVESRLNALRSQLNPHFLFNTLNAISTLVLKGDAPRANRVLSRLSSLLRICLDEKRPQLIPLSSELEFLNHYLEIQKVMLGDRLTVEFSIEPDSCDALVPCMLLQPIVENAVVHGVANRLDGGTVSIESKRDRDRLDLVVSDTGPGFVPTDQEGNGIGLANTAARLQQFFGDSCKLTFGQVATGGASVRLSIPFDTSDYNQRRISA